MRFLQAIIDAETVKGGYVLSVLLILIVADGVYFARKKNKSNSHEEALLVMNLTKAIKNARGRSKGFGDCLRCKDTWDWKESHTTEYGQGGCFPLCEECWQVCDDTDIIRYYSELVCLWRQDGSWFSFEDEQYLVNVALEEKGFEPDWEGPVNSIMRRRMMKLL